MSTETGRTTKITDLQSSGEDASAMSGKKQTAANGLKTWFKSLDWATLIAIAGCAFVGQKIPLEQAIARAPWAFHAGSIPVRSIVVAVLFALLQAFWLSK